MSLKEDPIASWIRRNNAQKRAIVSAAEGMDDNDKAAQVVIDELLKARETIATGVKDLEAANKKVVELEKKLKPATSKI